MNIFSGRNKIMLILLLQLILCASCQAAPNGVASHVKVRDSERLWEKPERTSESFDPNARLLLVLFDGFRNDYLDKTYTPNFDRLVGSGVKPAGMRPAFLTKTYPGQTTIARGLYQESHGIVGNRMYDPVFDSTFNVATFESRWWDSGGEPVWVTYQKAGGQTASVYYVGDSVNISGITATYHVPVYDESMTFNKRVDFVVGYMANASANLGLLYYHEPDEIGHTYGPDSQKTFEVIRSCDTGMGYLLDQLTDAGLMETTNIVVTSDHGMADVSPEKTVFLDDYVDASRYSFTDNNPVFSIWPADETDTILLYNALIGQHPNMTVYLKEDIPGELHYRDNRRISPIFIIMDEGWHVWTNRSKSGAWTRYRGNHGFLNTYSSMEAIFIASGPAFKTGLDSSLSFEAVDVYNLLCHVLGISPAPNNGTFGNVQWMLADVDDVSTFSPTSRSASVRISSDILGYLFILFVMVGCYQ